jgi:hypothetical protein
VKPKDAKHTTETAKIVLDMVFAVLDRIEARRKRKKEEASK